MGNHAGKDGHGPTGSHLDLFHTPPSSPSDSDLVAMALSQGLRGTQSPGAANQTASSSNTTITDWSHTLSVPPEWALIGLDSSSSPEDTGIEAGSRGRAVGRTSSPTGPAPPGQRATSRSSPLGSCPSEHSWLERDSGLGCQAGLDRPGEEMVLALLNLLEHHRASLGLHPGKDATAGAIELLRHLLVEREELAEEVRSMKDTLRTEREEWQQFQSDLQVAVSVADRLRMEAEEALGTLRERHRDTEGQLDQALSREQERDRDLETLRAEHRDACLRLTALTEEHQQNQAQLDALRSTLRERREGDGETGGGQTEESARRKGKDLQLVAIPAGTDKVREDLDNQRDSVGGNRAEDQGGDGRTQGSVSEESLKGEESQVTRKGVAEAYLQKLAAVEKKREDGCGLRDPRRIVMMSERSWSLSRLPLPIDPPSKQNGIPQNPTSTTLPLCKKEDTTKEKKMDRILKRQDSWSSFYTKKQEEDQNTDFVRPQDGFSMLLRRHGGSRRNSLLRWCQSRTQGYENIEITNFSSSWEDGLAFCAVYHTYMPTHIPYSSLNPEEKKENLCLAFQTGESIGITATLTVEEMLRAGGPDWQRVLSYVESMYRHFEM
ncbi:cytospin-A-like [Hypomesus transpacificus]|uniref:cytospin-A-like n=1 Tax=Hypomesus transpacificus TaxID=137520 RepID=UPI001F087B13|nr:cytospin-A-like [Hypomesus transpacificus]